MPIDVVQAPILGKMRFFQIKKGLAKQLIEPARYQCLVKIHTQLL